MRKLDSLPREPTFVYGNMAWLGYVLSDYIYVWMLLANQTLCFSPDSVFYYLILIICFFVYPTSYRTFVASNN